MKCSFCDEPSVACSTRAVGEKPEERLVHTKRDTRRVIVVCACANPEHLKRLATP